MEKSVSIVVLTWNKKDLLERCLKSIVQNTPKPYELIVADNGSTDGTAGLVESNYKDAVLVRLEDNRGVARGINAGLRKATGDYIFFLSNDVVLLDDTWVKKSIEILDNHPQAGALGYQFIDEEGKKARIGGMLTLSYNPYNVYRYVNAEDLDETRIKEVDLAIGVAFALKKPAFEALGGFDEGYLPFYFEDGDFFLRMRKKGYKILTTDKIVMVHAHGSTTHSTYKKIDLFYYATKNRIRFKLIHFPLPWLLAWLLTEWRYVPYFVFTTKDKGDLVNREVLPYSMRYIKALWVNLLDLPKTLAARRRLN